MVKSAYYDKNGVKKGAWSEEEDEKLRAFILRHGHLNWRMLPKFAGLERCGKSCRLRWMNYLRPGLRRGNYTKEEADLIAKLHRQLGNKWSAIAAKLPGRSDNDVKNYWHTHFQKCGEAKSVKHAANSRQTRSPPRVGCCRNRENAFSGGVDTNSDSSSDVFILESSISNLASSEAVESDFESPAEKFLPEMLLSVASGESDDLISGLDGGFWSQPFMVDSYSYNDGFSLLYEAAEPFMY